MQGDTASADARGIVAEAVAAYRGAGYDFIMLSGQIEVRYGWRVTDTRGLRDECVTTILGRS